MYRRMARRIARDAAAARGAGRAGVALLEPGSVMVTDMVTQFLLEESAARGLPLRVVPGVSSVECVLAAFGYDAAHGLQVVQAQMLLLRRLRLDPAMAAVVIQPGYYDTLFWAGLAESRAHRFRAMADYLATLYPDDAPMAFFRLRPAEPFDTSILWFRLHDFAALHGFLSSLHTLFIPPVPDAFGATLDARLLDHATSWPAVARGLMRGRDSRPRVKPGRYWFEEDWRTVPSALRAESDRLAAAWDHGRATRGVTRRLAEPASKPLSGKRR
jgi:hypothetical protein